MPPEKPEPCRPRFGVDLDNAASDLREAVSQVSRRLPDRVEQVSVVKADDDAEAIVSLAVVSDVYDQQELTRRIKNDIVPELTAIDGVATVNLSGERAQQLRVVIDPIRLSRFGLTVGDVADALRQAPFDVPVGTSGDCYDRRAARAAPIRLQP